MVFRVINTKAVVNKCVVALIAFVMLFNQADFTSLEPLPTPKKAEATYQFAPTGGTIVTGSNPAILGASAANAEGTNTGDYKGAIADDNLHFGITSTTGGYNVYLDLAAVQLNNANILIIQTEFDEDVTAPATLIQICDWVSSTGVNNAADSECTTGGWRNLNINDVTLAPTAATGYSWQIYNGFWNTSATAPIDTPLTNFLNSGSMRIRFFSTTNTTSVVHIDYLRAFAVVNPVYGPSGATQISGGAISGDYSQTIIGGVTQTGSDNAYFRVPGTGSAISDFYLSFDDVRTYAGANTILVRAEYSCSAVGINHRPKIYNFTTALWEDLAASAIACATGDATNAWAKNNVIISDYISNGEIRVGWYGSGVGTQELRLDMIYVMLGTTNSDSGAGEISFGSVSAGTVTNTRTLDMTGTASTWNTLSADESNTQGFASYANDGDNDVTVEEASAANIDFAVTVPPNTAPTGVFFASRHMSGVAGNVQLGVRDYGGLTGTPGGWSVLGAAGGTTLVYTDNIVANTVATGGAAGWNTNPEDYVDTTNNQMNLRLRTNAPGATTNNSIAQWDFAMVSLQWVEDANHAAKTYQYAPTGGAIVAGSNPAILGATAAATEGVNMGDWRGAIAPESLHFGITSTTGGFNAYLDLAGVALNGANQFIIQTTFDLDTTAPTTLVQICDWVSSTGVNNAADAQCTTGGWRNLNLNDVGITTITPTGYSWHIYNGYWNTSATAPIDTPLTNFVNSGSVRIRYFSTTNTTSVVHIDHLRLFAVVNPAYGPSSATQITGGTIVGDYSQANFGGAGQTGSDNAYFRVPGTAGAISDFYFSFDDVKTYTGANTILVRAEYSCSNTGINHTPKIYNFTTALWENLAGAAITCSTTDVTNAWAKNNITISDYVQNGEIRVGLFGSANNIIEIRIDQIYVMIGTTNTDGTGNISFGSNSAGTVANTRTLDMTGTASTWNILSADESNTQAFAFYANDGDSDATVEEASAANMDFAITVPANAFSTGVYFASRHMSGTGGTVVAGIRDYGGLIGTVGGWSAVGGGGTTALTYTDNIAANTINTGGSAGWNTNQEDHFDTVNNETNMRLRTSVAGATTNNAVAQWDFAMMSPQWIEVPKVQSLTFSISDNTVGFGSLQTAGARYATGDSLGSGSDSMNAHTISVSTNADSGYAITLDGSTLTCVDCAGATVDAIGGTAVSSSPGTEQFGVRGSVVSGNGTISTPYDGANWAFDTSAFPDVFASGAGDSVTSVFGLRYLANISATTEPGQYSSGATFIVTASY